MALAINTRTGKTVSVPDHYVGHPVLGKNLVLATDKTQAAPKKETKIKEQPAPVVEVAEVLPEPEINIEKNEE
jgi:hypothetical protein